MPRILSAFGGIAGAVVLAGVITAPAAYADPVSHNGSAFGVKVDVEVANQPLVKLDPLPLVKSDPGGDESVVELDSREIVDQSKGVVHARLINAASNVENKKLTSRASVADLELRLKSSHAKVKGVVSLTASLVTAQCVYGPDGVSAESKLADVELETLAGLNKKLVASKSKAGVSVPPNTGIKVAGLGKVVLNEQIKTDDGLVVNAVHVYLNPKLKLIYGDIVVSQATCYKGAGDGPGDPSASPTDPGDPDDPSATPSDPAGDEPSPTDSAGGGDLPVTGFKLATFAGIGVALVAAGIGALWFTRRRRAAATEEG